MNARTFFVGVGLMALALTMVTPAAAQQQGGTITGRVVQGGTLRPLAGAQISIPGSGLGTLANADGRFIMINVPPGQARLRVQIIGYGTQDRNVAVVSGQTVTTNFELETEALGLDEIVVTGTVGTIQRRAVGNVVGTLNTGAAIEKSAPANIQQMMDGQVAGVSVQVSTGLVGSGGGITIRGPGSVSLGKQPLLYIDGVRASGGFGSFGASRINDLNPEDIERIEVIKGPAAATLYGTEASNGVIQVITKKGVPGEAKVEIVTQQGANWFNNPAGRLPLTYGLAADGKTILSQNLFLDEEAAGRHMFRTGQIDAYALNVRGGQGNLTYFFSGGRDGEEGYLPNNSNTRETVRTNIQSAISDRLDMSVDLGVVRSHLYTTRNVDYGLIANLQFGTPLNKDTPLRGFATAPPEIIALYDQQERLNRATVSTTTTHRPTDWLSQRFVWGLDWTDAKATTFFPRLPANSFPFFGSEGVGTKTVDDNRNVTQTFDYNATVSLEPTAGLTAATSFGVQYFTRENQGTNANGIQMPTPAVSTVSSGSVQRGGETYVANKTFGVFLQETMGWRGQAFLTAALRADANSAFGESFKAAYYPKLSGTWVISDAGFWNVGFVESLRLRSAWGKSGLQPDAFASTRTYSPATGPGDLPTVRPGAVGNPDLKPEVGTELEVGFDASFLQGRLTLEATHYRKTTNDAIMEAAMAPSSGFASTRFVNVGVVSNRGYEAVVMGRPIAARSVGLSLTGTVARNSNELVDDGGVPPLQIDRRGRFQMIEGYPLGGSWSRYIATAEWGGADGKKLVNVSCYGGPPGVRNLPADQKGKYPNVACAQAPFFYVGNPGPGWTGSLVPEVTIGDRLTLNALVVFAADRMSFTTTNWKRDQSFGVSLEGVQARLGTLDPIKAASFATESVEWPWHERDDYVRLRDLSLSYSLPSEWVGGFGASRAMLTLTGRNLYTRVHAGFRELDPESRQQRDVEYGWHLNNPPIPHSVLATLRVTF